MEIPRHCTKSSDKVGDEDPETVVISAELSSVFRENLPSGLPPQRDVRHAMKIEEEHEPPQRSFFQLSSAELATMKDHIADLVLVSKIRPSRSTFGASLFCKAKGEGS